MALYIQKNIDEDTGNIEDIGGGSESEENLVKNKANEHVVPLNVWNRLPSD